MCDRHDKFSKHDTKSPTTGRAQSRWLEEGPFWSAAAALAPYGTLQAMVDDDSSATTIARSLEVSNDLVAFRLKTTKLWRRAKARR